MTLINRAFHLVSRPRGEPSADNFALVETQVPELAPGECLVEHHYLSLDPYMRGRMNEGRSYATPQSLNAVMIGATVGVVRESRHPRFQPGDTVIGTGGWQTHAVVKGDERGALRKIDARAIPMSVYLGAAGMPGVTAWYGLEHLLVPKPGETLVVSAASGAVGSVVGQLARLKGVRAIGIAGGAEKCTYVRDVLGFDACVDYRAHDDLRSLARALRDVCPQGVDAIFENVGGRLLDAAMLRTNPFARIAVCGMIAGYNGEPLPMANPSLILVNRLRVEGFIVSEHLDVWPQALGELAAHVQAGRLRYRETVAQGLDAAPGAFLDLLKGRSFGKQLVKLV